MDGLHVQPSFCISFASLLRLSPCCVPLLHCWRTSSTARGGRGSSRREKTTDQKVQDGRAYNLVKPCKPQLLLVTTFSFQPFESF